MLAYLPWGNGISHGVDGQPRVRAMAAASGLYHRARGRARWGKVRSLLTGRRRRLLKLTEVEKGCTVRGRCYGGRRTVPVRQIRGSEGRCEDFDCDFNPLKEYNQHRWLNIAAARHVGMPLPPVDLIQVEDVYFVSDGHHRISVAQALGQKDIEAEVTVWHVDGPLPWEEPVAMEVRLPTSKLAGQPT